MPLDSTMSQGCPMYDKTLIRDDFGQYYTIQSYVNPRIRGNLCPKEFPDHHLARQFMQRLQVPTGYWQGLMQDNGGFYGPIMSEADMVCAVCERIVTGRLKVFPVNPPNPSSDSPQKRAIRSGDKVYRFAPSVEQLLNKTETRHFNGVEDARAFLQGLKPDTEKLKAMAGELNIPFAANTGDAEISRAIAESLAVGDTVVMVDTITSATPPAKLEEVVAASGVGNKKADLGPHESESNEVKLKDIDIQLEDEFEQSLGSHASLLNDLDFTLTTDMGEEHKGKINDGRIFISQAQINSSFELKIKELPGYQEG